MLHNLPKVAVVIASYNHENYILDCLNSVLQQDYKNIDIYISDDCSSDNTTTVLSKFLQKLSPTTQVSLFKNPYNIGIANNFNKLIDKAKEDIEVRYIIPFAGDDVMLPSKVSKQVKALQHAPQASFCYSNMEWFNSQNGKKIINHFGLISRPSTNLDEIISEAIVPTPTLCIRRDALTKVKFNPAFPYCNDYLLTVELGHVGHVLYLDEILVRYRKHSQSAMEASTFASERLSVANFIKNNYGFDNATSRFAKTAEYDVLLSYLRGQSYLRAINKFIQLLPTFFSSRKWFCRMMKFFWSIASYVTNRYKTTSI